MSIGFASRLKMRAWAQSEPPRGSGWVRSLWDRSLRRTHPLPRAVLTVPKHSAMSQGSVLDRQKDRT